MSGGHMKTIETGRAMWFAFRVPPQKELRAAKILRDKGFRAVVPVARKWRRKNRFQKCRTIQQYPLMYGYVLMRFEGAVPWFELFSLSFIQGVVGFDGKPGVLDTQQVEDMLDAENGGAFSDDDLFQNMRTYGEYSKGDNVHVFAGGLDGLLGKVLAIRPDKVTVEVPLFNSKVRMTIPPDGAVKAA